MMKASPKPVLLGVVLAGLLSSAPAALAETDPKILKDLQTVIALQGKPCGKVTKAEKLGENDYLVTCSGGNRYRVKINEQDRVVITDD